MSEAIVRFFQLSEFLLRSQSLGSSACPTDLQIGEQAAVRFIQRVVKPRFLLTSLKYCLSVLIGYSNTG